MQDVNLAVTNAIISGVKKRAIGVEVPRGVTADQVSVCAREREMFVVF